jgi:outer membrane receptor protein involved in Fe transport
MPPLTTGDAHVKIHVRDAVFAALLLTATAAGAQQRTFNVPREAAVKSIPEFARQAGVQIVAPADQLAGVTTPAIQGQKDVRAALKDLIAGTGLTVASDDGAVIALKRDPGLPPSEGDARVAREAADATALEDVIVTGSRFATRAIDSPSALSVLPSSALVGQSGNLSLGDRLSLLPQFRATFTQAASTGIGVYAGVGQVGLNLLDLRGLGPSRTLVLQNGHRLVSSTQQLAQPDTNTIPSELLERVEVLTGGASAVYGADAIAGVVNFVLKDDYEGLSIRAGGGASDRGDASTGSASATWGTNFADGRGNLAASLAFDLRDGIAYSDRPFSDGQSVFVANALAGQPGQPQRVLIENLRVLAQSAGGTLPYGPPFYRFGPDGSLAPTTTGSQVLLGSISNGGNGLQTLKYSSLLPDNRRATLNVLGHLDLGAGATAFAQLGYTDQEATAYAEPDVTQQLIRKTNPYLSAAALATINAYGPTAQAPFFVLLRSMPELGAGGERDTRRTLHSIAGVKGALAADWKYEVSYSYGRTKIITNFLNEYFVDRLDRGVAAVRDTSGSIGCGAGCVPINLLGDGTISAAARDYVHVETEANGLIQQHDVNAFVSGDTRAFLSLPGGPIGVVAGVEYRKEKTSYRPDERDLTGLTNNLGTQTTTGSVRVVEAYTEVKVPLLADLPAVRRLELSGSARMADYDLKGVGTRSSWGLGLLWAPVESLRVRGSYQRAVRAPNIAELFQASIGTQFFIGDPCDVNNIGAGTSFRVANCRALGVPAGYVAPPFGTPTAGTSGGNPNLGVETATTWTAGIVYTPASLTGASVSLDYYRINLSDAIVAPNPQVVIQQCVDSSTIDNVFCRSAPRDPITHNLVSIAQQPLNLNRLLASGVDLDASLPVELPWNSRLTLRLLASYVIDRNDYQSPTQPNFPTQIVESMNNPRYSATLQTAFTRGPVTLGYNVRYFSMMYRADPAFFTRVGGNAPLRPNWLPADLRDTGNTFFHDVRLAYTWSKALQFYAGVDNVGDKAPPPGIYGAGYGGAIYDNVGRYFYAGARLDFQ